MAGGGETGIEELDEEFKRLRRRAAQQKRVVDANPDAWRRWSDTMDEIARIVDHLAAFPAPNIESLAIKFSAILWLIEVNDSLLDRGDLRRLRRFGGGLRIPPHRRRS